MGRLRGKEKFITHVQLFEHFCQTKVISMFNWSILIEAYTDNTINQIIISENYEWIQTSYIVKSDLVVLTSSLSYLTFTIKN